MTAVAREVAYAVLLDVVRDGKYSNIALLQHYRRRSLADRDKALCTEIVYGTLQVQRSLDVLLAPLCSRGIDSVDERVLILLRMSVYQLGFLSRVPEYAVLNDAVELCKSQLKKSTGFVNGVLRSFTRDKRPVADKLAEATRDITDFAVKTGVLLSYPDWFVRELEHEYGRPRTIAILEAGNVPAPVSVRVNLTKTDRDSFIQTHGETKPGELQASIVSPVGVRLGKGVDIEHWPAYQNGLCTVQDEASMLVAPLLGVETGQSVLDLCAGLGTKTTQILELQGGRGDVVAVDIHQHKLDRLERAATRLGLSGVDTVVSDARFVSRSARHLARYDAVLLDAPCSGMGVLRRRPEIRWRRTHDESQALAQMQVELLQAAVAAVRPGGVIVYATCTILPRENDDVVNAVLAQHGDELVCEEFATMLPKSVQSAIHGENAESGRCARDIGCGVTLTPECFGTDGFYMTRIRKQK